MLKISLKFTDKSLTKTPNSLTKHRHFTDTFFQQIPISRDFAQNLSVNLLPLYIHTNENFIKISFKVWRNLKRKAKITGKERENENFI